MKIYGAGLAGLLAANAFPTAEIFEAGPEGSTTHKALLRFRSSAVGDAVGIDFKKVRVHKGIYYGGKFVEPNIKLANLYSQKVIGRLADRSIWNLDPVDRYIAPEDFIEQMVNRVKNRLYYSSPIESLDSNAEPVISTIPMPVMARLYLDSLSHSAKQDFVYSLQKFQSAPINVDRFRVQNADVYQTIYFPDPDLAVYRASITGDLMIVESVAYGPGEFYADIQPEELEKAFGLRINTLDRIESNTQRFGKIAPIDDNWRKKFIFDLTTEKNIYSLGRFSVFKNILLDDVLKDISVIKKLMNGSDYGRKITSS
jgi:hypothetical protein